jgi:hypothetical protein
VTATDTDGKSLGDEVTITLIRVAE